VFKIYCNRGKTNAKKPSKNLKGYFGNVSMNYEMKGITSPASKNSQGSEEVV
ncbi:unnamed protein product, partial [Arctogadus glacialis]